MVKENRKCCLAFHLSDTAQVIRQAMSNLQVKWSKSGRNALGNPTYAHKTLHLQTENTKLSPRANGTLNPEVACQYYKDTGHMKDNCIRLNYKLTHKL